MDFFASNVDTQDLDNVDAWSLLDAISMNMIAEIARQSTLAIFCLRETSLRAQFVARGSLIAMT